MEEYKLQAGIMDPRTGAVDWVQFPTTTDRLREDFDKIGVDAAEYKIFECKYGDVDLTNLVDPHESLDVLNYLGSELDELDFYFDEFAREKVVTVLKTQGYKLESIDDIWKLIDNTNNFEWFAVSNDWEFGQAFAEYVHAGYADEIGLLADYIDYEAYGKNIINLNDVKRSEAFKGYLYEKPDAEWEEPTYKLGEPVPEEYRISDINDIENKEFEEAPIVGKAVVVEPGKTAQIQDISYDLKSLQSLVNGHIACLYPFEEPVGLVCNDEAKLEGMMPNRALYLTKEMDGGGVYKEGDICDIISGPFVVVGLGEEDFAPLSDELAEKFAERFKLPELFYRKRQSGKIKALLITEEEWTDLTAKGVKDTQSATQKKDKAGKSRDDEGR